MRTHYDGRSLKRRLTLLVLVSTTWAALPVRADEKLPTGEAIMEKYLKRSGGEKAYARIKDRVSSGTVISDRSEMHITIYETEPNKRFVETEAGGGVVRRGTDGNVVWRVGSSRTTVLEGAARNRELVKAFFHMPLKWRELCVKAECKEITEINGRKCYKVDLTTKYDFPQTYYIAVDSNLLVAVERKLRRGSVEKTVRRVMEDYKEVDGILYPHKITQSLDGQGQIKFLLDSIKHNTDLHPDLFALPHEVIDALEENG